ncbi:unnamed protein product [Clavelina lepadiformis]|uniref:Uncharacterized protein n=1 Tax=Clavelina lepadiformis TaxID=159417 RepID=A0ABP0F2L8_CLALP
MIAEKIKSRIMGSCCSKGDVVAVKENIGPNPSNYQMLITENIGVGNGTQGKNKTKYDVVL